MHGLHEFGEIWSTRCALLGERTNGACILVTLPPHHNVLSGHKNAYKSHSLNNTFLGECSNMGTYKEPIFKKIIN